MSGTRRLPLAILLALTVRPPPVAGYAGPEACAQCHEAEHAAWRPSLHARAFTKGFEAAWKRRGQDPACLACHTTGHERGTARYAAAGVTCEACHGPLGAGHPADAKMPLPVSSDMCRTCHVRTHQEWKVSRHGQKGIRCFDCHKAHGQGLRAGGGDALCGSCHPKRQQDFAHATHHRAGLTCATCHLPVPPGREDAIAGTGSAGHALAVGAEVCARCHEDTVHRSARLPGLREEVGALKRQMAAAGVSNVFELKEHAQDLEWRNSRLRQGLWLAASLAAVVGFALGWLAAWVAGRRRR